MSLTAASAMNSPESMAFLARIEALSYGFNDRC